MTSAAVESTRWPRKKWIYAIFAVFAFQVGAILVLSKSRDPGAAGPPTFRTAIYLATDPWAAEQLRQLSMLSEPTVFALPSWQGFSRDGWLAFTRPEFRLTDWTESPQWLSLDTNELGDSLHQFILSNTMPALLIADKPLPRVRREELSVGNAPVNTRSELEVAGELAAWLLPERAALPSWPHSDVLTNTVVQIVVNGAGYNVAAVLLAGSGLAEADEFALRRAKAASFRAPRVSGNREASASRVASGKLIFKWHTLPATNIASAAAVAAP